MVTTEDMQRQYRQVREKLVAAGYIELEAGAYYVLTGPWEGSTLHFSVPEGNENEYFMVGNTFCVLPTTVVRGAIYSRDGQLTHDDPDRPDNRPVVYGRHVRNQLEPAQVKVKGQNQE